MGGGGGGEREREREREGKEDKKIGKLNDFKLSSYTLLLTITPDISNDMEVVPSYRGLIILCVCVGTCTHMCVCVYVCV